MTGTSRINHSAMMINHRDVAQELIERFSKKQLDKDWRFKDFFGTIYLLSGSKERLPGVRASLASVGLQKGDYKVFQGIRGESLPRCIFSRMHEKGEEKKGLQKEELEKIHCGQTGCFISHYRLIEEAQQGYRAAVEELKAVKQTVTQRKLKALVEKVKRASTILVFEDNVGFGFLNNTDKVARENVGYRFVKSMKELPKNWDFFYLMGWDFGKPKLISKHMIKLDYGVIIKSYAIKYTAFDPLLKELKVVLDQSVKKIDPVDHHIAKLHKPFQAYMIHPPCCYRLKTKSMVGRENDKEVYQPLLVFDQSGEFIPPQSK